MPAGTLARIDAVLEIREKRAELLREAVEREVQRRQRNVSRETPKLAGKPLVRFER